IGIMDAAMAIESRGDITYGDKGNMTQEEIDKTIKILIDLKKAGHFRAFWTTFDESVNLMASGEVAIQSMWSPAVTAVRARGIPCYYVPLQEGYRAWASVWASWHISAASSWRPPMSTSTGTSPAGRVGLLPSRATIARCPKPPSNS